MCVPGMANNSDGESPSTNLIEVKVSETQGCRKKIVQLAKKLAHKGTEQSNEESERSA